MMIEQGVEVEMSCGHGDDAKVVLARRFDVARGVAYDANRCVVAGEFAGLAGCVAYQFVPVWEVIAEAAEAEPFAQACCLDFDPTDHFKIAGGDSKQCAAVCQMA